jgi:hypothetical protein
MRSIAPRFRVASVLTALMVGAASFVLSTSAADAVSPGPLVYGVNSFENEPRGDRKGLQSFDAFTGDSHGGHQIVVVGGTIPGEVLGATGLAVDPMTDIAYVLLRMVEFENTRILATIDLTNGEATTIGDTTRRLTSLTFDSAGTLYASEGGGNFNPHTCPHCLHTLSKTTAVPTKVTDMTPCPNPGSSCGHGIAFNPDDGLIYHTTGTREDDMFESVMTTTPFTKTPIGYTGAVIPDTVYGIGYDDPNNRFIITDWNKDVFSVTAAGVSNELPSTRYWLKGLHVSDEAVPTDTPPVAVDDTATMTEGDPSTAIDVYDNDSNPDGGPELIESITQPANGEVGFSNSTITVSYTPKPGYCNDGGPPDEFTYTLNGGSTATVSVTVNCVPFIGPLVFGVQDSNSAGAYNGGFEAFDAGNGQIEYEKVIDANVPGSVITGPVFGATALTSDPRNGTLYAILRMSTVDHDVLATLDPLTGEATTIGDTDHNIVGLASTGGALYGVTDGGDLCEHCLFKVNTTNGSTKLVKRLLNSGGQSGIAFRPTDKKIYRATASVFQTIDPARSFRVTDVGYGGASPSEVMGLGYDPATGGFILTDRSQEVWRVNPQGGAFEVTDLDNQLRGVVVSEPTLSLKYSPTKRRFTGDLLTPGALACDEGRDVSVWRDVSGPDVLVAEATTDAAGRFVLPRRANPGKYFATVDAASPTVEGFPCPDAKSRTIRVL